MTGSSLRTRITLLLLVLSIGPPAAVVWLIRGRVGALVRAEDQGRIADSLAEFDAAIRREGEDLRDMLESVGVAIAADRSRPDPGGPAMRDYAPRLMEASRLDGLVILDPAGTVLSSGQAPGRAGLVDTAWRDVPAGRAAIVEDEISPGVGRVLTLQTRRPLPGYGSGFHLVGGKLLDAAFLRRLSPGGSVKAILLDRGGAILAASHPEDPLPVPVEAAERLRRATGRAGVAPAPGPETTPEATAPGAAPAERDLSTGAIADRGVTFRYRARTLRAPDGTPIGALVAAVSLERLERLSRSLGRVALAVTAAGAVASLLVGLALAGGVTRPLRRLQEMTGRIAREEYEPMGQIGAPGEVGDLVRAFDRMAASLRDSRERLRRTERLAAAEEVARRVAHEIKNPLAPIALTLAGLRRTREVRPEEFDAAFEAAVDTIQEEIRRMRRVLDDFARFGRLPAPRPRPTDLNQLILSTSRLYRDNNAAARIDTRLDPSLPLLAIDPDLIGEVINNLIGNALQAIDRRGGVIGVSTRIVDGGVEVSVRDDGPGLSEEARRRLFEPYFSTRPGGTGLGLSIARRIVLEHGGTIEAGNHPEGGAEVRIRLPIGGAQTETAWRPS